MRIVKFRNQKSTAGLALSLSKGFSLIEMLVVVSIFTIVTAIVLANLPSFRDKSSLDLVAQEIAIQIRGAQTYAMSTLYDVKAPETGLFAYAIVLPDGEDKQSFKLRYTSSDNPSNLYCQVTSGDQDIKERYVIKGNFEIGGVCQNGTNPSSVSICFKRPNGRLWSIDSNPANYSIVVWSKTDHTKKRYINVSSNGQIYVDPDSPIAGCSFP